jgi:hypothetical protein
VWGCTSESVPPGYSAVSCAQARVTPKYVRKCSHQVPHTCTPQLEPDGMSVKATTLIRPYVAPRTMIVYILEGHASPKSVRERLHVWRWHVISNYVWDVQASPYLSRLPRTLIVCPRQGSHRNLHAGALSRIPHTLYSQLEPDSMSVWATTHKNPYTTFPYYDRMLLPGTHARNMYAKLFVHDLTT